MVAIVYNASGMIKVTKNRVAVCITALFIMLMTISCSGDKVRTDGPASYSAFTERGPNLRIVFRSDIEEEGNSDIYLSDETGKDPIRLTDWPGVESFPTFGKVGSVVYFVSDHDAGPGTNSSEKNTEIYFVAIDREGKPYRDPYRLTDNDTMDYAADASWFGYRMVFMSDGVPDSEYPVMFLTDDHHKNPEPIVTGNLTNTIPKIDPNGHYIVYNAMDDDGDMDIYTYNVDSGEISLIVDTPQPEFFPSINFDASLIVFERQTSGNPNDETGYELFSCDINGENERQLTDNTFSDTFPSISGDWVTFISKRWDFDGDGIYDEAIYVLSLDDLSVYKVTSTANYQEQPDLWVEGYGGL